MNRKSQKCNQNCFTVSTADLLCAIVGKSFQPCIKFNMIPDGESIKEHIMLRANTDHGPGHFQLLRIGDVIAVDMGLTGSGCQHARDHIDQCRFSRSIVAQNGQNFVLIRFVSEIVHRRAFRAGKDFGHSVNGNCCARANFFRDLFNVRRTGFQGHFGWAGWMVGFLGSGPVRR